MGVKSGDLIILPPLGPAETKALDHFLGFGGSGGVGAPSHWTPFEVSDHGITWDSSTVSYVDLDTAAKWLTDYIIPKFIKPLRHMTGQLLVSDEGMIKVIDNVVTVHPFKKLEPEPAYGLKADGTPKAKPGPKPKSLKEVLAASKKATAEEDALYKADYEELVAKVDLLENQLVEAKKPKKQKVPKDKRWYRLTVPKEIDKEKFVEGLKLAIMGVEEIEVFE